MAPAIEGQANGERASQTKLAAPVDFTSQLKWYYTRLFPMDLFGRWLGYGSEDYLARREISFTLAGDIYIRWRSFPNTEELQNALKTQTPVKIDIGAVYNFPPKDKSTVTAALTPEAKELVFDIDLTDYEDVIRDLDDHPNESATERCDRHWPYMATAVRVLDAALREDFGFKRIMWVYSGRRGIHAWICDAKARSLTSVQRAAVADYLNIRVSGRGALRSLGAPPLHPALARAKALCEKLWLSHVLEGQDALRPGERAMKTLADLRENGADGALRDGWDSRVCDSRTDVEERWRNLEAEVKRTKKGDWGFSAVCDFTILKHTYPRLDVNVSKEINHLLKAPFCVHPKTGRICVPFRAEEVEEFNPATHVPLARELIAEIKNEGTETDKMKKAVGIFEEFVKELEKDTKKAMLDEQLKRMDARGAQEIMSN